MNQMRTLSPRRTSGQIEAREARSTTIMLLFSIPAHCTHSSYSQTDLGRGYRGDHDRRRRKETEFVQCKVKGHRAGAEIDR